MKRVIILLFTIFSFISCSDINKEINDKQAVDSMPDVATWKYSGTKYYEDANSFHVELSFRQGTSASILYGRDLKEASLSERISLVWKMIDSNVYMYLNKRVYPESDDALFMEGIIRDNNKYLDIIWHGSLGSFWDTNAENYGWNSYMTLELIEFEDFGWGNDAMWYPWNIPGFENKYDYVP